MGPAGGLTAGPVVSRVLELKLTAGPVVSRVLELTGLAVQDVGANRSQLAGGASLVVARANLSTRAGRVRPEDVLVVTKSSPMGGPRLPRRP